jgi:flagellar motor switch protein FliG
MQTVRREDKIAVLLTILPRAAAECVLTRLGPERGERLRGLMERARTDASPEVMDKVLREFEKALLHASRGDATRLPRLAPGTDADFDGLDSQRAGDASANAGAPEKSQQHVESASIADPIAELRLIASDRLAAALEGEHPRGVATVLCCLDAGKACETLKRLPPDVRKDVFPRLGQAAGGTNDLALRIAHAIIVKCRAAADEPAQASGEDKAQMMADMLKSMERADRMDLLKVLEEQDGALAAAVRDKLYIFEDLLVIEGRSMQKLLAEVDSKTLAVALKDTAENIAEKVMGNLSKRARETLTEEISFLSALPAAQVQQARQAVVEVIQRMDQAGELVMTR